MRETSLRSRSRTGDSFVPSWKRLGAQDLRTNGGTSTPCGPTSFVTPTRSSNSPARALSEFDSAIALRWLHLRLNSRHNTQLGNVIECDHSRICAASNNQEILTQHSVLRLRNTVLITSGGLDRKLLEGCPLQMSFEQVHEVVHTMGLVA